MIQSCNLIWKFDVKWIVQCNKVAVMQLTERGQIIISN